MSQVIRILFSVSLGVQELERCEKT